MSKMKVIDLLNKIANGEEVPHFKIGKIEYYLNWRGELLEREEDKPTVDVQWFIDKEWLNIEVEIIEEPNKIEPFTKEEMEIYHDMSAPIDDLVHKVSLIIDYINRGNNE